MKPSRYFAMLVAIACMYAPPAVAQELIDELEPQVVRGDEAETDPQNADHDVLIAGEILELREVRLLGQEQPHLLARVDVQGREVVQADLGRRDQLARLNLTEGDSVTLVGVPAQLDERPILVATRVEAKQDSVQIDRSLMQSMNKFSGTIEDTRYAQYEGEGAEHLVAKVRVQDGTLILLDLGAASALEDVDLSPGTPVAFVARIGTINDRRAYFAEDLRVRDSREAIQRSSDLVDVHVASHSAMPRGSERAQRLAPQTNRN